MRVLWVLLAVIGGVGAGLGVFVLLTPRGVVPVAAVVEAPALGATAPMASVAAPTLAPIGAGAEPSEATPASASASAAAAAAPSASATASASAAAATTPEDVDACLRSFFSKDAFVTKAPSLRFACDATKPKEIASRLRVAIVDSAGGNVSESMKEWSQLGFYELAVVATLRGRCCADVKPLELPSGPEGCGSVVEALEAIATASRPGRDEAALEQAVERFDGEIRCAIRLKRAATFGYSKVLPGEASVFTKIRARAKP